MDNIQNVTRTPTVSSLPKWVTAGYLKEVEKFEAAIALNGPCSCKCCQAKLPNATVEPIAEQLAQTLQDAEQAPESIPEPETAPPPPAAESIRQQQQEVESVMADLETPEIPFATIVERMQTAHDDVLRAMADSLIGQGDGVSDSLRQDFLNDLAAYWVFLQSLLE